MQRSIVKNVTMRWGRVTAIFLIRESAISKYYMSRVTAQLFSQTLVSRLRLNILFVCSCPLRNATGKNRQQQSLSESALFSDKQFNLSQPFFGNATQIGNIKRGLSESSVFCMNNSTHLRSCPFRNTTGRNRGPQWVASFAEKQFNSSPQLLFYKCNWQN